MTEPTYAVVKLRDGSCHALPGVPGIEEAEALLRLAGIVGERLGGWLDPADVVEIQERGAPLAP